MEAILNSPQKKKQEGENQVWKNIRQLKHDKMQEIGSEDYMWKVNIDRYDILYPKSYVFDLIH